MSRGRLVAAGAALVAIAAAVYLVPLVFFKPWTLEQFYGRLFLEFVLRRPMLLSQLRLLEPLGLDFHNDELDDLSPDFQRREAAWVARQLEILRRFDRDALRGGERLSYEVLEWFLEDVAAGRPFMLHDYPINPVDGLQAGLPEFLLTGHRIDDLDGAEDYVTRVGRLPRALEQLRLGLEERRRRRIVLPLPLLRAALREMREFTAIAADRHPLYLRLEQRLEQLDVPPAARRRLLERLEDEVAGRVYPAYAATADRLEELTADSGDEVGVWRLPDGEAFYAYALGHHATRPVSASALHQLGLDEVTRIEAEMRLALDGLGLPVEQPGATVRRLATEPAFLYADDDQGRARILADARAILDQAEARLDELFPRRPPVGVRVAAVAEADELDSPRAFYQPPPPDRSGPGVFYLNLRQLDSLPRFRLRTLVYHEAVPGHHSQGALAPSGADEPLFRRLLPFTAFVEGWALYAERLAAEHGLLDDPHDRLGHLDAELFRAARLVTDTGIHHLRWDRERAIAYLSRVTGLERPEALAEIDRQIVSPGRVCASKVGQTTLLELRARARGLLGERFDLRRFHAAVLRDGALPLTLLEGRMEAWMAGERGTP